MSKYIDADAYEQKMKDYYPKFWKTVLTEQPTIDIVRCKECKRSYIEGQTTLYRVCGLHDITTDENNYCSWGEREGE
jgi:hypothetical protein